MVTPVEGEPYPTWALTIYSREGYAVWYGNDR